VLPTEDDLRIWVQHTGASSAETEVLLDMLYAACIEYTPTAGNGSDTPRHG
jgi:hypothetical protein